MMPKSALFFAAGLGTRMAPLTNDRPKPLIKVAGKTLLDHALGMATGIPNRVVNIHYKADQMRLHVAGTGVAISDETDALMETGGGLRKALPLLGDGPVYTMNTDAVWTGANPFEQLAQSWNAGEMAALLLLVRKDDAVGYRGAGDFVLSEDGRLTRGAGAIYTGAQIIDPARIRDWPAGAFSLGLIWDALIAEGRVYGVFHQGGWCDVGRPDCIPLAEALLS